MQEITGDPRKFLYDLAKILTNPKIQKEFLIQKLSETIRRVVQVMPPKATARKIAEKAAELWRTDLVNGWKEKAGKPTTPMVQNITKKNEQETEGEEEEEN